MTVRHLLLRVLPPAILLAAYALFQAHFHTPACRETDTAGYLTLADRLAAGGPIAAAEDDLLLHQSHVWVENGRGEVLPKYSPGLPLLMAAARLVGGPEASFLVSPLCGALALLGAWFLFRLWMSLPAAWLATLAMGSLPMFLAYCNYPLGHAADLAFVTWGMYFLWRWKDAPLVRFAAPAGLCLGFAAVVRPASILLAGVAVPAVLAVLWRSWRERIPVPRAGVAALALSYAAWPVLHACYNAAVFGSPWTSGYSLSGEQDAFSAGDFRKNLGWILGCLGGEPLSLYYPLGLAGLLFMRGAASRTMALCWATPLLLLHASYYWTVPNLGMAVTRFFFAAFPAFIGAGFAMLDHLDLPRWHRWTGMAVLVAAMIAWRAGDACRVSATIATDGTLVIQRDAARRAVEHLPAGATVFSEPPAACWLGRDFRVYELGAFQPRRLQELQLDDPLAPRMQRARKEKIEAFYARQGQGVAALKKARAEAALAEGRTAALLVPRGRQEGEARGLGSGLRLETLVEWTSSGTWIRYQGNRCREIPFQQDWGLYRIVRAAPAATAAPAP